MNKLKQLLRRVSNKLSGLNRNTKLALILFIILLVVGIIALVLSRDSTNTVTETPQDQNVSISTETEPTTTAKITSKQGTVEIGAADEWTEIALDTELTVGSTIRTTGSTSRAIIELEDGSIVRIGAGTEITFEKLTTQHITIHQKAGYVYNRVTTNDERIYAVRTENAEFQAQGTAFMTIASGDEQAVEVYQGSVIETVTNTTTAEGKRLVAKSNTNPANNKKSSPLDIEILKENEFVTWNRTQDLTIDAFKKQLGFLTDVDGPTITIISPAAGSQIETDAADGQAKVIFTGTIEKNARLSVQSRSQAGSSPVDVTVDTEGNFTTPELTAPTGNSVFEFIGYDRTGNKTTFNSTYTIIRKAAAQTQSITLTKTTDTNEKAVVEWTLSGLTTPDGVMVVYATTPNPTFSASGTNILVQNGITTKEFKKSEFQPKKTYYVKICRYNAASATCDSTYSNQISFETK